MHTAVPERRMKGNNALKGELNSQREEPRALKAYAELQVKNVENTNQLWSFYSSGSNIDSSIVLHQNIHGNRKIWLNVSQYSVERRLK